MTGNMLGPLPPREPETRRAARRLGGRLLVCAEVGYVVLTLLLFSRALVPLLAQGEGTAATDRALQGIFVPVYAGLALLLASRGAEIVRTAARSPWTWALVALAVASALWSEAPGLTVRRGAAFAATTLFGVYLAARFAPHAMLRLVAATMTVAALLSIAAVLWMPAVGLEPLRHEGAWRGVFVHKNTLGSAMSLGAAAWVILAWTSDRGRRLAWAGAALCLALVLLSRSTTALVITAVLLLLLPLLRVLRSRSDLLAPALTLLVVVGGAAACGLISYQETLLEAVGKDVTLSGRVALWDTLLQRLAARPWLGHGYAGFWLGWEGESAAVWERIGWAPQDGHNGLLDLWLSLGAVGTALFLCGGGAAAARSLRALRAGDGGSGWVLALLAFVLLSNLTESSILDQNGIVWTLYVYVAFSTAAAAAAGAAVPRLPVPAERLSPGVRRLALARAAPCNEPLQRVQRRGLPPRPAARLPAA